ncbi:adenylate kinase 9 isoform X2 [Sceloporus undulatus]|uniref:adenylate kinase 9 isoform X2 n=1 Tax=Sceloporus undulatus TaxID=8520 RepID=UPI001C4BA0D5|nr:adenylate kinase 9 isoform X2 [Sceloporus undulatus]
MASQQEEKPYPFVDIYDEDEADRNFLLSKPTCFVILGKPGVGKKTLAKKLAQFWKCTLINASELIEENMTAETEYGVKSKELLFEGQSVPEELLIKMLLNKLESPEVMHFGYVLCDFPSLSEEFMSIPEQIDRIRNLKLKPDFLINIKCPDNDLSKRISGQRQQPETGQVFQREEWDPDIIEKRKKKKKEPRKTVEEEEEEEEEEAEEETNEAIFDQLMLTEILPTLVQRPEDFLENVQERIAIYKDTMLHPLEELMAEQDSQYLFELDGNKTAEELFTSVILRLQSMGLRNGALITKLQSAEEEMLDGLENDELFRVLAAYKLVAPRYRWRRSRWGRACPVALKGGDMVMGSPDFAISFLGKMYLMSSEEALKEFMLNPRPYLLPPMPLPPCKVLVIGPPLSGRSTLCELIANHYQGKVLEMEALLKTQYEEARIELIEQTRIEAIEAGIAKVKERLETERLLQEQATQELSEKDQEEEEYEESTQIDDKSPAMPSDSVSTNQKGSTSIKEEDETEELSSSQTAVQTELTESSMKQTVSDVSPDHPDVQEFVQQAIEAAMISPILLPPEVYAGVLEEAIAAISETNKDRYPEAAAKGGWVIDNFPPLVEHWAALSEKGLLPDLVICLKNVEQNGRMLVSRLYQASKEEIDAKIIKRLTEEALKKKQEEEETKRELQEMLRLQAEEAAEDKESMDYLEQQSASESQSKIQFETESGQTVQATESTVSKEEAKSRESELIEGQPEEQKSIDLKEHEESKTESTEHLESEEKSESPPEKLRSIASELGVKMPEYPEDGFPDVVEIEPLKKKIIQFMLSWQKMEAAIAETPLVQTVELETEEQTPDMLFNRSILAMEKPFKYHAWELSPEDEDEEQEDLQAEAEALAEEEEEEEDEDEDTDEEEEEDEEKVAMKKRHMGDTKHFCPVVLKENFILHPGFTENTAKYKEKYYYFANPENRDNFLEKPEEFVSHNEPLKAPPIRIFLLGSHGAGKTVCARWLADKLGIFHIQFEERLQELIMIKTGHRVGTEDEEEEEEDASAGMHEMVESTPAGPDSITETEFESEDDSKRVHEKETQLTDEEEAIKANITDNEPIPMEVLDTIVLDWWMKEPFRSTGFVLDGFPRTGDEAQYLAERMLCPDVAVFLEADEDDVTDRLLPTRVQKWREKQARKMEKKQQIREMKERIRAELIAKRRAQLVAEAKRRGEHNISRDEGEVLDEEDEDEEEDIEAVLEEEFPKDEDEGEDEEEEEESDAIDRMKTEIVEKYETDISNMQTVQEELDKFLIPQITINCKRKIHIVCYQLYKKLKDLVENRESIFEKCYPLSYSLARKMIVLSYKHPSNFGQWDPIKLFEGDAIKPFQNQDTPSFPALHRNCVYFFTSKENREVFMKNPIKYLRQPKPKPTVPVKIAIVGPPKSGKTTVAKKFASTYGLMRLSMGDALRWILNNQPETELALVLKWHLHKGLTAPDELAIRALDTVLMDTVCNTTGFVIDGYPVTRKQVSLLEEMKIIPVKIFELQIDVKEVLRRALLDKQTPERYPYPMHDSSHIFSVKNSCYKAQIEEIRPYYEEQHQNWYVIDAYHSKWWIWDKVLQETQAITKQIQSYLERIRQGKAASIADMCIMPEELLSRLGEFGQYCPVTLAEKGELVDCSESPSLQFAAEFRGHYYKMAGQEELDKFLNDPERYVPPLAPYALPLPHMLPKKLTAADVKALFPMQAEMQGYCPVTYLDGKQRYEALVPGDIEYAILYRKKLYIFESEEKLQKFMRLPEKYWNQTLPTKLPPLQEPILLTALPLTGYLEQGVATALIKAMNEVGCLKPKFPFISVKRTALLFIAYHLKAYNPRSSDYIRKKYKRKLEQFVDHCELIPYLGTKMTQKYKEPQNRPIDFDHKLQTFLSLKDVDPSSQEF